MRFFSWASQPWNTFWLSLAVLLPIHLIVVVSSDWFAMPPKPVGDGPDYENIAYHLSRGSGYLFDNGDRQWQSAYDDVGIDYSTTLSGPHRRLPATGRPPLLPTLIAGIYAIVGRGDIAFSIIRILSASFLAVSGAISAALVMTYFRAVRPCSASEETPLPKVLAFVGATAATVLAACNGTLQSYSLDFLSEPLALLLMQLFVLVVMAAISRGSGQVRTWMAAGAIMGLLILTRSIFVLWLPATALLVYKTSVGDRRHRRRAGMGFLAISVLVCVPWWARNVYLLGSAMPLGTQGPITLVGGYSDEALEAGGEWQPQAEKRLRARLSQEPAFAQAASDLEREVVVAKAAGVEFRTWISANTAAIPKMFLRRLVTHWNPYFGQALIWKIAVLFGVAALCFPGRRRAGESRGSDADVAQDGSLRLAYRDWLVGLPCISTAVAMVLYTVGGRFLVPLYGILFTLAGIGVARVCKELLRVWWPSSDA